MSRLDSHYIDLSERLARGKTLLDGKAFLPQHSPPLSPHQALTRASLPFFTGVLRGPEDSLGFRKRFAPPSYPLPQERGGDRGELRDLLFPLSSPFPDFPRSCRHDGERPPGPLVRSRERAFARPSDRRAGIDDHHPWHALPQEPRNGPDAGRDRARGRGHAGDDRRDRGTVQSRPRPRRAGGFEPAFGRRGEGLAPRPRRRRRAPRLGGHHRRGDDVYRRTRGNRDFRDRRHRRRASRRRGDVRHFRRSRRTLAHQGRGRLRGREIDPRHRQDARISGIAGRRRLRLSLRRIPGVLRALQRRQARSPLRRRAWISRA